jgi:predicted phage terminase large subunit-like protein
MNLKHLPQSLPKLSDIQVVLARRSFWEFCKLVAPDFYKENRNHLKTLCDTLQDFYDGLLPAKNLIIEMPPRHGKSRTLINFTAWVLGRQTSNKIITASFNDDLAQDFSRYCRDLIAEQKNDAEQLVYSDIFSNTKIKQGDASYKQWSLEGQFFNYKGTGIGGSVTGRGGNYLIIDDPVKDAETAYNPSALDKIWLWYSGTFASRAEEGAKQIVCMTPWAKSDLSDRLTTLEPDNWYVLKMPAYDGKNMLCADLLSYETYSRLKKIGDSAIISANYDLQRIDIKGRLYSAFKTYETLPDNTTGSVAYCDTADEGDDYLCSIHGKLKDGCIYVTDILYTQDAQEITEPLLVEVIKNDKTLNMMIESNNGGRAFARNIMRILSDKRINCNVQWFHQSKNKRARILTNASIVQACLIFPENWGIRWPSFYAAMMDYQKEGKNKHDDAPDTATGIVEKYIYTKGEQRAPEVSARALGL